MRYHAPTMRIVFVDLLFSWPPHGGADVDLYHVMEALHDAGRDVHLIGVSEAGVWERGAFNPGQLPFPSTRLDFTRREFNLHEVPRRIREAVDRHQPDAVILCDGFFMKPHVCAALKGYPILNRFYAYESICHRDILHYKDGGVCPLSYLDTPDACRQCAFDHLGPEIRADSARAWVRSYVTARAFAPEYHALQRASIAGVDGVIVYNPTAREQVAHLAKRVFVVPGGVDTESFIATPLPRRGAKDGKVILMTGRAEDPLKGLDVLLAAGERLWRERRDFVIWATMPEDTPASPWFRPIGWRDHYGTAALYRQADIVVVPSVWDEPFGLVAVEAMATGRPVCASRVGGLQTIVRHLETGFLFPRGDSAELAKQLSLLLDNAELRTQFGKAGRAVVEEEYAWPRVIARHYVPILAYLASAMDA
jgi:glycosyltransferase involved in cell wall biosynthesis